MLQEKTQVFIRPLLEEGRLKSIKIIHHRSYSPAHEEFENLCFISVAPTLCMLHAFVYNAVNVRSSSFLQLNCLHTHMHK